MALDVPGERDGGRHDADAAGDLAGDLGEGRGALDEPLGPAGLEGALEGRALLVIDAITPVPESRRFCNQPARESTLDGKVRRDSITIENK